MKITIRPTTKVVSVQRRAGPHLGRICHLIFRFIAMSRGSQFVYFGRPLLKVSATAKSAMRFWASGG